MWSKAIAVTDDPRNNPPRGALTCEPKRAAASGPRSRELRRATTKAPRSRAQASADETANGAPQRGAVAVSTVSLATKRAPLQLSVRPVLAWLDTPPAAGRAWVPDRRARTFHESVGPLYDESTPCGRPGRDRFVISISSHVYMPLTGTRRARPPCLSRPHGRLPGDSGRGSSENIRSAQTIRQNVCSRSPIYVVIRLHRFLVALPGYAEPRMGISFLVERSRPTPPGPDRRGPRSPPRRGPPLTHAHWPAASFAVRRSFFPGGRPPGPPGCGLRPRSRSPRPCNSRPRCGLARGGSRCAGQEGG
jgi:hypothetical protein